MIFGGAVEFILPAPLFFSFLHDLVRVCVVSCFLTLSGGMG